MTAVRETEALHKATMRKHGRLLAQGCLKEPPLLNGH